MLKELSAIIDEAEKMKHAYFFRPPTCAGGRRSYEKYHSHDMIMWEDDGHQYTAKYDVSCSCSYIYAKGTYTRDGKPTTLTAIRNSYKRMIAKED